MRKKMNNNILGGNYKVMNHSMSDLVKLDALSSTSNYVSKNYSSNLLDLLNSQRGDRSLCDYEIRVENASFYCHKCVLVGISDFFRAMLSSQMKEAREDFVELKVNILIY